MRFDRLSPKSKMIGLAKCEEYVRELLKKRELPATGFSLANYEKMVDSWVLKYLLKLEYEEDGSIGVKSSLDFTEIFDRAIEDRALE